jgi:hypothetical protein
MVTLRTSQRRAALNARLKALGIEQQIPKPGRRKYANTPAIYNGQTFDSAGEAEFAMKLDLMKQAGVVLDWWRPKPMVLVDAVRPRDRITYRPDFAVLYASKPGTTVYLDYKGSRITETEAFRLKVKLWKRAYPDLELRVVYSSGEEKVVCAGTGAAV